MFFLHYMAKRQMGLLFLGETSCLAKERSIGMERSRA